MITRIIKLKNWNFSIKLSKSSINESLYVSYILTILSNELVNILSPSKWCITSPSNWNISCSLSKFNNLVVHWTNIINSFYKIVNILFPYYAHLIFLYNYHTSHVVLSNEPISTLSPYGKLNDIEYTTFEWPINFCNKLPIFVSHIIHVL